MLKIRTLTLIACAALALPVLADDDETIPTEQPGLAAEVFSTVPEELLPILDQETRLDMVAYFNSPNPRPSKNRTKGEAEILSIEPQQLIAKLSKDVTLELTCFDWGPYTTYVFVETIATPVPDSSVRFFTPDWQEINMKIKADPASIDTWLLKSLTREQRQEVMNQMPFLLTSARVDPELGTITFTNNLPQYYPENDRPEWLQYLQTEITYAIAPGELVLWSSSKK